MRGRFVSGFDASRRRLTGTAGQRRFDAFAGGYDALGNPTGGVGPASNRGGSTGGKKSGGSSSAKRAKTQVDEGEIGRTAWGARMVKYVGYQVAVLSIKKKK